MELSPFEARKLALQGQGLHRKDAFGRGVAAAERAVQQLGYVQIDTISVVARAHLHTLWNRVSNFSETTLDQLLQRRKVFEYWSHAAAYLPIADYRFSLPRKRQFASGQRHWHPKNDKLTAEVLQRIQSEGPLRSSDLANQAMPKGTGWWDWKPTKVALEQLFMEGELMVSQRVGFQKVYDLTERVLPSNVATDMPTEADYAHHLINRFLTTNGLGTAGEIAYLRRGMRAPVQAVCRDLCEVGDLVELKLPKLSFKEPVYALPKSLSQLSKPLSRRCVRILSPFDNCVIQRSRLRQLFDFDYQIECYVPAAKRRYGYFVLPILYGHHFTGRVDCKVDRQSGCLQVLSLYLNDVQHADFVAALGAELQRFADFNGAQDIDFGMIEVGGQVLDSVAHKQLITCLLPK
ncbi:hypothetical protein GCM10008090_01640 [Arenicella chitinivorans]|uniref:Winged helix-turn-helix domain-containing protein n=2 Tax=Arenicella chitinivorans TaxID=1329800 RepID=A0A918VH10_9GAMM|nr:hypothetical protein GCM10008090_01640 [Arenicella chitinivorans]